MSERLRPRDLAFLAAESPRRPCTTPTVEIFEPGRLGLRLRPAARADRGPDLVRAALPAAAPVRARAAGQPGVGRRRGLRPHLPRTPLRAAASGQPRPAPRARRPDRVAPAGPQPSAVGDVLRRGPRGRPGRAAVQVAPGPRRRGRHRRPRPGAARRRPGSPKELGGDEWRPARAPTPDGAASRTRCATRSPTRGTVGRHRPAAASAPCCATADGAGRRTSSVVSALAGRRPGARDADQRPRSPSSAAFVTVRTDLADYRTVRDAPRRHRQRRHPRHRHRCAAQLADGPRGVAARAAPAPRGGADLGHRRASSRPTSLGSQIAAHFVDLPIGRVQPGGPAAPGVLLVPGAQGDRPRASRPTGSPGSRASRRPRSTRSGRGSRPRESAPRLPPQRHQRARAAVAALRRGRADGRDATPSTPLLPGPRRSPIGVTSYDGGRVLRRHRRPRRCCPTSTCSGSACARPSTSWSTPHPAPGRAPRAAARGATRSQKPHEAVTVMSVRVYVPLTSGRPGRPRRRRTARPARSRAHAVTEALRVGWPDGRRGGLGVRRADGGRRALARSCAGGDVARAATWSRPTCRPWRPVPRRGPHAGRRGRRRGVEERRRRPRRHRRLGGARRRRGRRARRGSPRRRSATCCRAGADGPTDSAAAAAAVADTIGRMDAITFPPAPINEPNLTYAPGSPERAALVAELEKLQEDRSIDLTATHRRHAGDAAAAPRSRSCSRTTTSTCSAS